MDGRNSLSEIDESIFVSVPMIMSGCRLEIRLQMSAFFPFTELKLIFINLNGRGNLEFVWALGRSFDGDEQWKGLKFGDSEAIELKERLALWSDWRGFWADSVLRPWRS